MLAATLANNSSFTFSLLYTGGVLGSSLALIVFITLLNMYTENRDFYRDTGHYKDSDSFGATFIVGALIFGVLSCAGLLCIVLATRAL